MKYLFIIYTFLFLPTIVIGQQNTLQISYIEEFGSNDSGGFTNWKTDLTILNSKSEGVIPLVHRAIVFTLLDNF